MKQALTSHTKDMKGVLEALGIQEGDCSFDMLLEHVQRNKGKKLISPRRRWHDAIIASLVREGDSLLDLGCGKGELMACIGQWKKHCRLQGIELDEAKANCCIERGLPVCQADMRDILPEIPDGSYTWAVMENTLQTLDRPLEVMEQMLRIADRAVIAFPNFAHWSVRFALALGGRMPVTKALPLKWYNTPNIHFCSISDFQDVIRDWKLKVLDAWVLEDGDAVPFQPGTQQNVTAEQAMFIVSR